MGVIYKLTDDVLRFIIDRKKADPNLSCRKLADIVRQAFNIHVSKSSVNAVLKETGLSSPVGRHAGEKGPGKERSPAGRKDRSGEGRRAIKKKPAADPGSDELPMSRGYAVSSRPEGRTVGGGKGSRFDVQSGQKSIVNNVQNSKEALALSPEGAPPRDMNSEEAITLKTTEDLGVLRDAMGMFFLKAAQWELMGDNVLFRLFKESLPDVRDATARAAADLLVYGPALDIDRPDKIVLAREAFSWVERGPESWPQDNDIRALLSRIEDNEAICFHFTNEIPAAFAEASCLCLHLADGSRLCSDGQNGGIAREAKEIQGPSSPLNQLLGLCVRQVMVNDVPFFVRRLRAGKYFAPSFFNLVWSFCGSPHKQIQRISVLDPGGREEVSFSSIPHKTRRFIGCLHEDQPVFQDFVSKRRRGPKALNFPWTSEKIFYEEIPAEVNIRHEERSASLRAVLLLKEDRPRMVLLTNASREALSAESLVRALLNRWPDMLSQEEEVGGKGTGLPLTDSLKSPEGKEVDIQALPPDPWEYGRLVLAGLNACCQKYYFSRTVSQWPFSALNEKVYRLPGFLKINGEVLEVSLKAGNLEMEEVREIKRAARAVTNRCVVSPRSKRLILDVVDE